MPDEFCSSDHCNLTASSLAAYRQNMTRVIPWRASYKFGLELKTAEYYFVIGRVRLDQREAGLQTERAIGFEPTTLTLGTSCSTN